jgi:predicted secreted protein
MFNDRRNKRVIFVAHCILNQNSISDGTADLPAADREIVTLLLNADVGIVQLPCPELRCLGLDRGDEQGGSRPVVIENTRIRTAMMRENPAAILDMLVSEVLYQVEQYLRHGFWVMGVVGIDRSPSCGVETTSKNDGEVAGMGLFMESLQRALTEKGFAIPFIGIKSSRPAESASRIEELLALPRPHRP